MRENKSVRIGNSDTSYCKVIKELPSKYDQKCTSAVYIIFFFLGVGEEKTEQN